MSGPPKEILEQYKRDTANYKQPTKIPNEDFSKLKKDILKLRALAEKRRADEPDVPVSENERSAWRDLFPEMALSRPTLFSLVANVDKDVTIALGMVDILQAQREAKNCDIEDANHKLVTYMCDQTGFAQGKAWLAQSEKERRDVRLGRKPRSSGRSV